MGKRTRAGETGARVRPRFPLGLCGVRGGAGLRPGRFQFVSRTDARGGALLSAAWYIEAESPLMPDAYLPDGLTLW